jgi:hypothetical protein
MKGFNYDSLVVQENLDRVAEISTLSIYNESKEWYPKARKIAQELSKKYNRKLNTVCALISVFSPQKAWHHNLILTEDYLKHGKARHTTTQVEKARAILNRGDVNMDSIIGGEKTINFYHNILNPQDSRYCTIDSHMYQLMLGTMEVKKMTTKQYRFLKEELITFAKKNNRVPSEQQAELWITWKQNKFGK